MPSFFKKLRHRKSASQSSNTSDTSQPASPRTSTTRQPGQGRGSVDVSRRSEDVSRPLVGSSGEVEQHQHGDVVVIDKVGGGARDHTGHGAPFQDETHRPDLPTTTSNANNPVPVPTTSGSTSYVPHTQPTDDLVRKPLPAVPEANTPLPKPELEAFPLPPAQAQGGAGASIPHSHPHHHLDQVLDDSRSPPLPHVNSVDRSNLHPQSAQPDPSASATSSTTSNRYPDLSSLPAIRGSSTEMDGSKRGNNYVEVPQRGSSLALTDDPAIQALISGQKQEGDALDLSGRMDDMSLRDSKRDAAVDLNNVSFHPELDTQRDQFITDIVRDTEARSEQRDALTQQGHQVFKQSGMDRLLGTEDTVDMATHIMDPVVKELIIPKVHTEYTTVITRCIHKTHYIPLIQPIHDPDPIVLRTRHRIFSPQTGKWHEVIGDEAAIEILGEDVFRNGPQERRELRKPALPGLEPMDEEAKRMAREAGIGSTGYSVYTTGGIGQSGAREFKHDEQINIPIRGTDVALDGIGQGGGSGRVLEREYEYGSEPTSDWKEVAQYAGLQNIWSKKGKNSAGPNEEQGQVGVAL
ncbi:hypothetical protein IAU60_003074 [Kwoniella sp. DSM 27419]